jgi:acyl carrier protein
MQEKNGLEKNVITIIAQALRADEKKITLQSSLIKDLGAESIDFLDIVFRLEKAFKIKIPKGELFPEKLLTDTRFVKEGKITAAGIEELKTKIPSANWEEFSKNPLVSNLGEVFTVGMIVDYLYEKLAVTKN